MIRRMLDGLTIRRHFETVVTKYMQLGLYNKIIS